MGGPVAQLLWRRHRDLVDGLVLCATSVDFMPNALVRNAYQAGMLSATVMARLAWPTRLPMQVPMVNMRGASMPAWAAGEMRRHDWRMIIEAGHSICTYNARRWIGDVDVPTSVVCTTEDRGVAPSMQLEIAQAIPGATVHSVADGHLACANARFADPLVAACLDVSSRVPLPVGSTPTIISAHQRGRSRRAQLSGTDPKIIDAQRVEVAEREHDVRDDHDDQRDERPVVHERGAGRMLSGNGSNQRMIEPVASINTIDAPTKTALSF